MSGCGWWEPPIRLRRPDTYPTLSHPGNLFSFLIVRLFHHYIGQSKKSQAAIWHPSGLFCDWSNVLCNQAAIGSWHPGVLSCDWSIVLANHCTEDQKKTFSAIDTKLSSTMSCRQSLDRRPQTFSSSNWHPGGIFSDWSTDLSNHCTDDPKTFSSSNWHPAELSCELSTAFSSHCTEDPKKNFQAAIDIQVGSSLVDRLIQSPLRRHKKHFQEALKTKASPQVSFLDDQFFIYVLQKTQYITSSSTLLCHLLLILKRV
jgi:hypothetical protein